jgi:hypothetical protein
MVILMVVSLPVFWLFRPVFGVPARFTLEECQRIALTDTVTGRAIIGIEDMELLPDGDTLILSASDRLALEWDPDDAPEGGLYADWRSSTKPAMALFQSSPARFHGGLSRPEPRGPIRCFAGPMI